LFSPLFSKIILLEYFGGKNYVCTNTYPICVRNNSKQTASHPNHHRFIRTIVEMTGKRKEVLQEDSNDQSTKTAKITDETKTNESQSSTETSRKITPFLWFNDNAEEAVKYYASIFKNSKIHDIHRKDDRVLLIKYELEGQMFYCMNGGPDFTFNPAISMYVSCETQEEIDELWSKLLEGGGKELQCGWLTDRYGLSWQIIPSVLGKYMKDKDPVKADRVFQAMQQMIKLDIKALTEAYEQP
jgi:predicted 3-demethylubiquinone-9 3-methyltransferase (glyoxalase superfamily)